MEGRKINKSIKQNLKIWFLINYVDLYPEIIPLI